jgi:predicted RNA-binding Zn ribbon-like protein
MRRIDMADHFPQIAGHPALDLLNTIHWRLAPERRTDDLASYADVLFWAEKTGFATTEEVRQLADLAKATPDDATSALAGLVLLRESAYRALIDQDAEATAILAGYFRQALEQAELKVTTPHWTWQDREITLSTPQDRVARSLLNLMQDDRIALLHQCEDDACGWVYLDTSPRRNRRWCVAADCGDRNRAREYYRRHKTRQADAGPA